MTKISVLRSEGTGRFVFVCDHASNRIPPELNDLGLPECELARHIAWDIGAAGITEVLSGLFDSPAILATTSRLVIDCNRHLDAPGLIPEISDRVAIPGNRHLAAADRIFRIARWFQPYHEAIEGVLADREARGLESIPVSVHSMTDCLAGVFRPWQIALSSNVDRRLTDAMLVALRAQNEAVIGDNQPYDLDPRVDYTIPIHAMRRGLPHLQVEFRQDEITEPASQRKWAARFAECLSYAAGTLR